MNHELTAKWHELDKVRVGLKDVVVLRPDLRVADGYIQYSTDSGSTWQNLIALAELKGAGMDITGATVGQIAKITAVDASGVPIAWEPVDMPSGDGGGGSVQSDWNQNDDTQPDYVKNRPFYTGDPVETVLVEESTVSFSENRGMYMGKLESAFSATDGETYKVSWDGTVYECTCVDFYGDTIIGNRSLMGVGSDTGEPFVMIVYNAEGIQIATADTSASHTFSISGIVASIVKIPVKYIDKDASGYIAIHSNDTMTEEEAENYKSAILKREVVFIIWDNLCINDINLNSGTDSTGTSFFDLVLSTQNNERYRIEKNSAGLFDLSDLEFSKAEIPGNNRGIDNCTEIFADKYLIHILPKTISSDVGSKDVLFKVEPNGIKSKAFDVLGNGEAVTPALILYSSTADSTKKFRITVDDSGTISATEVTA